MSTTLCNFMLEYALRPIQKSKVRTELNGVTQVLAYADDLDLLGDGKNTATTNMQTLLEMAEQVWLEVNKGKRMKCKIISSNRSRNEIDRRINHKIFGRIENFKYIEPQ